ncbi:MAG: FixH family protein [Oxalobacteraceae bacterium]
MQERLHPELQPGKAKIVHWYKEPWVWLVISGPAIVIVAGFYTAFLAFSGNDKVVAEDYYKQGLMINATILHDVNARDRNMSADMEFDQASGRILVHLKSDIALPDSVQVSIAESSSRSAVSEFIRRGTLNRISPGTYQLTYLPHSENKSENSLLWHVKIEAFDWRLTGDWPDPMHAELQLKAIN